MVSLIKFFIKQKLFINLMVFLIIAIGAFIIANINREAFPNVNFDLVTATTIYPGASPDEIEQLISIPIEKKLREVDGIDKVRAYNIENVSVVAVYIDPDERNKKKIVDDVKDAIESVDDLPENAETPVVEEVVLDKTPVLDVALTCKRQEKQKQKNRGGKTGQAKEKCDLRQIALDLEDYLYEIDGVAEVERFGVRDKEYLIEVNPSLLDFYHIGLNTMVNKIKTRNYDLPGGVMRLGDKEYLLRTKGQFRNTKDIEDTVVLANLEGYITRVKDIAKVSDTLEEIEIHERFQGRDAIILKVWKKKTADTITVSDKVKTGLLDFKKTQNGNLELEYFDDYSRFVRSRLNSLFTNAGVGFVLLIAVLVLLLGLRMSLIVSVSLPIAFMIAFMGMSIAGITLNIISMFALVMVLGMIVDFSIVVSENSYRYMEGGMEKIKAIELGVSEVVWPVTTTLLIIAAAFAPLLYMTGLIGKFVWGIPMVIIMTLTASWFASMFILPSHLNAFARVDKDKLVKNGSEKKDWFSVITRFYRKTLGFMIRYRYTALAVLLVVFFAVVGLGGAFMNFVLFPGGGGEKIFINAKMPQGTKLETTLKNVKELEKVALSLDKQVLDSLHSRIGTGQTDILDPKPGEGTHKGTLIINLTPVGDRSTTDQEILRVLRKKIDELYKKKLISKDLYLDLEVEQGGPPVGKPINVEVRGEKIETLKKISEEYKKFLSGIDGIFDISSDLEEGKEEFRFFVREEVAAQAGVSVLDVAMAIRIAFDGEVATKINRDEDEIDVRVRFPESSRRRLSSLREVHISNNQGGLVPLSRVAYFKKEPGYGQINRLNYKRIVQIQANVDTKKITSIEANQRVAKHFKDISKRYLGYEVNYGGEQEDTNESIANLGVLFIFALFLIYIILATFFQSLIIPGVVMSAIPFGLVGVILALLAHFEPLSFMSLLGVVSLAGVIVSNTLVLVQFINNLRKDGLPLKEALVEAGAIRLRPVILTTGTTVLGLFPTIYGLGGEDKFVAPLALAFGYGLIFATFITLVLIPIFYHISEDYKKFLSRMLAKVGISMSDTILNTDK